MQSRDIAFMIAITIVSLVSLASGELEEASWSKVCISSIDQWLWWQSQHLKDRLECSDNSNLMKRWKRLTIIKNGYKGQKLELSTIPAVWTTAISGCGKLLFQLDPDAFEQNSRPQLYTWQSGSWQQNRYIYVSVTLRGNKETLLRDMTGVMKTLSLAWYCH